MIPADVLVLFAAASAALAIAPGPDNIFVLTQSALHGRKAGVLITLGLCTGLFVHISAVALGVAAILETSILAFTLLKLLGAGYLLYLAWQAFHAHDARLTTGKDKARTARAYYVRGIIMNVSNPKVAVFFLAFLPQFTEPQRGPVFIQVIILGLVFLWVSLLIFCAIAWATGRISHWLNTSQWAQKAINRVAGSIFVLLALHLLLSRH